MLHPPDQKEVQRNIRAQVCADCPFRTPGTDANGVNQPRPCEKDCPLFVQLPPLAEMARQVDPLVGHPTRTLVHMMLEIGRSGKRGAATVANNGRKVVKLLENLFQA
jgi:hypothetical protein